MNLLTVARIRETRERRLVIARRRADALAVAVLSSDRRYVQVDETYLMLVRRLAA